MSCFNTPKWHSWSLLVVWALGSTLRLRQRDREVLNDCLMTAIFTLWLARQELSSLPLKASIGLPENSFLLAGLENSGLASSLLLAIISIALRSWRNHNKNSGSPELLPPKNWNLPHPKPWIFPCRTTHARMFPKRHAFGYSYLQCGYPIIPSVTTIDGLDISDGKDLELGSWWLRVRADDYLERGNGTLGFYNKLQIYLRKQGVNDFDWSYGYLITAPRFFGYAFNPVSFWYIYDQDRQLKWMILEVNNTFDERRMYLLDGSTPSITNGDAEPQSSPLSARLETKVTAVTKSTFTDKWMKDFHVSPFNSRKGYYALKALNPFPYADNDHPTVDNVITLTSNKDHVKLVARLYSTGKAMDPQTLGFLGTIRFVLSWWWVGLFTFPRILREAFKLFFKRSLHVWFRPEVLNSSIGRLPTTTESVLHDVFCDYLSQLVKGKDDSFRISLKTAIPANPTKLIENVHKNTRDDDILDLEIRVLTPVFYSRLVHYSSLADAIDRECVFTDEKNRTLWISRPQFLPRLLSRRKSADAQTEGVSRTNRNHLDGIRWGLMKKLRCPPPQQAYFTNPIGLSHNLKDIQSQPYSELDAYVRNGECRVNAGEYRKIVTKLFLAQRLCFGFSEVIDLLGLILRALLCYLGAIQLVKRDAAGRNSRVSHGNNQSTLLMDSRGCSETSNLDWSSHSKSAGLLLAVHAFGLLKGYT